MPDDQPTIVASSHGVLLARRHDGKPEWTFPSGAQEAGEVYADTAVWKTLGDRPRCDLPQSDRGTNASQNRAPLVYIAADPINGRLVLVGRARRDVAPPVRPVADHLRATLPA
jgi:hypothetical protein